MTSPSPQLTTNRASRGFDFRRRTFQKTSLRSNALPFAVVRKHQAPNPDLRFFLFLSRSASQTINYNFLLLLCTCHFDYALVSLLNVLDIDAPGVPLQQFRVGLLDLGEELLDSREHYYGNV
jgi:hypothetical protein